MNKSDSLERKFVESFDISDWEIETDTGWEDATEIHKTVPYLVYSIITDSGKTLRCADNHIIFDACGDEIFIKDCIPNQTKIITRDGYETVVSVLNEQLEENMYDITVDSNNHRYYTNEILSHNTVGYICYILWAAIFHEHKNIVLLANRIKTARDILARLKMAYENLPVWLQQGVIEWNKTSIELENGSKVSVDATTGNAARSGSITDLVLDEFAFVPNNVASDFFKSVYPTVTAGTQSKIIIVSTANGVNLFYKLWHDAEAGLNSYSPFKAYWWETPGRDEKWKEETIKNIGEEAFRIEYSNEFFGSVSDTLISSSKLANLIFDKPLYSERGLDVYELPEAGKEYCICVDTARGDKNNCSAFTVIQISNLPYKVVAKYRSNTISAMAYPAIIVDIAKKYNESYVLVEINDIGGQVVDIIKYELEYENVLSTTMDKKLSAQKIAIGQPKGFKLGLRTTTSVKRIGCSNLKTLIEEDKLVIRDFDIISELSSFISKGGSYAADSGYDDDLVMSLVMFGWLTSQKYFKNITPETLKTSLTNDGMFIEVPFAFKDNHDGKTKPESFVADGDLWLVCDDDYQPH